MPELHFPFVSGQHEEADARTLPAGMLATVTNVRIRKDGRLVSRYGYAYDTAVTPPAGIARAVETADGAILGTGIDAVRKVASGLVTPPTGDTPKYSLPLFAGVTCSVNPCSFDIVASLDCCAIDAISSTAQVLTAQADYQFSVTDYSTVNKSYARDGTKLVTQTSVGYFQPRLASFGSSAFMISRQYDLSGSTHLYFYVYSSATNLWSQMYAMASAHGSSHMIDVVSVDANYVYFVYYSSPRWKLAKIATSTGVETALANLDTSFGGSAPLSAAADLSMCALANGNLLITLTLSGNGFWAEVTTAGTSVAHGSLYAGGDASGPAPVVAQGTHWLAIVNTYSGSAFVTKSLSWNGSSVVTNFSQPNTATTCRPFAIALNGTTRYYAWFTDNLLAGGHTDGSGESWPTLRLVELTQSPATTTFRMRSDATAMQLRGPNGTSTDPRRGVAVMPAPSSTVLPSRVASIADSFRLTTSELVWLDHGTFADGLNDVSASGSTFVSGARVLEWDGESTFPSGLESGPCRLTLTDSATPTGPDAGSHQYVACWVVTDANGAIHRSPPSAPATITATGHNVTVVVTGSTMQTQYPYSRQPSCEVYRTSAGGSIFRLVGTAHDGMSYTGAASYGDASTDANIAANAILYTQGERGGLSGLLPNDEPPPCRYLCTGNSRLFAGGLEDPCSVQWSKLFYPGEQVSWSSSEAFRRALPEPVTAVASMDGGWLAFTKTGIYDFSGAGPDDNGASGDFGDAMRRPSDTGCISHRSLVYCSQGILFQGTNYGIWLLPRGGNAAQWIGQPIRDTLALYPLVRDSVFVESENCAYWAVCNTLGNAGCLIVYDLRNGQWYVDDCFGRVIHSLTIFDGSLLIDGVIKQTPGAYADSQTGASTQYITCTIDTGDIRPFDATGWGRCRMFGLLGEVQAACTLDVFVSYDSGDTWTDNYTKTLPLDVSTSEFNVQCGPSRVRGTNYRVRVMVTGTAPGVPTEGVALNALSLEVYKSDRLKRLPAAMRG